MPRFCQESSQDEKCPPEGILGSRSHKPHGHRCLTSALNSLRVVQTNLDCQREVPMMHGVRDMRAETEAEESTRANFQVNKPATREPQRYRLVSLLLARKSVSETVSTPVHFRAKPGAVWDQILLYEDIPYPAPLLLRTLLPRPVRTNGDKTRIGAAIRCEYTRGHLTKRITAVERPHLLRFDVVEQCLGIETCILTRGGSYRINSFGNTTEVVLTTKYQAFLHPRWFCRPLEALLVHQLHNHIVRSIRSALLLGGPSLHRTVKESLVPRRTILGGLACKVSQSCSRRWS
jgi:hypothetical protein